MILSTDAWPFKDVKQGDPICYNHFMRSERPDPKHGRQFTIGAFLVWIVLLCVALAFARYAVETSGALTAVALPSTGAAIGAPLGYFYGEDRVTGGIFGALVGASLGMVVAVLVVTLLVTAGAR